MLMYKSRAVCKQWHAILFILAKLGCNFPICCWTTHISSLHISDNSKQRWKIKIKLYIVTNILEVFKHGILTTIFTTNFNKEHFFIKCYSMAMTNNRIRKNWSNSTIRWSVDHYNIFSQSTIILPCTEAPFQFALHISLLNSAAWRKKVIWGSRVTVKCILMYNQSNGDTGSLRATQATPNTL